MQAEQGQFGTFNRGSLDPRSAVACLPVRLTSGWLVCLLVSSSISCARLQLPAIDPNGSSVFLPFPNTTQLALPQLHSQNGQAGIVPTPAFAAPTMPPPCVDGSCQPGAKHELLKHHKLAGKVKDHFASPGKAGEIQLTPTKIVAPVGGEVVLLAGICGQDGYLVKRQPLEWMLSPESVGTFIEVGDDSPGHLISSLTMHRAPKVEKLDVDFAKGRTSSKETLISRGSPECNDDIALREGQTWLSISSPSEGISRVTVLAPESEIWDRRRQTATIYWVDAQWQFPQPQIERSGNRLTFETQVTRADRYVPAKGWLVRYTIVDPSVAAFIPNANSPEDSYRDNVAEIRVDENGRAVVQVAAAVDATGQPVRGTTPITIDVIRPLMSEDGLPPITLGSGQTFATFSSPGLQVQAFGNDSGMVGEQLTYVASMGNPGDVPTENTQLILNIPAGMQLVSAVPKESRVITNSILWDQGVLDAHRQLDVSVVLRAMTAGSFDVVFQAVGAGNLTAESRVPTEITDPSVDLRFEPIQGAAQAEVGQLIEYGIDIKNTSRQTLTNVKVVIESDVGLPEANGVGAPTVSGERNKFDQTISYMQPGETQRLSVSFVVRQEGQLGANVRVFAGENNLLAEKGTSILGLAPRPKKADIGVSIEFPETIQVNEAVYAVVSVRNPGEVPLTGLNVAVTWDGSLVPIEVDPANFPRFKLNPDNRSAIWTPQDLLQPISGSSGATVRSMTLRFRCISAAPNASLGARAVASEGVEASNSVAFQAVTNVVSPPASPPVSPPVSPPSTLPPNQGSNVLPPVSPPVAPPGSGTSPRTGGWQIDLADYGDPTVAGNKMRYTVTIRNQQNLIDQDVRIEVRYPQGVQFGGATNLSDGNRVETTFGPNNSVLFTPINSVRAGEELTFIFVLTPTIPDTMTVRARVFSRAQPVPVEDAEETTVTARSF